MATFIDLDLSFNKHPGTKDVLKKTDVDAVKQSIKNIFFYNKYEKPFDPNFGINVSSLLFENLTPATNAVFRRKITEQITQYEPRCIIDNVVLTTTDANELSVELSFHVVGNPQQQTINMLLERVR